MVDYIVIGSKIRQYRIECGITQEDLALQINTSAPYISKLERGIKKPSLEKLSEIAEVLNVTVNDLIYCTPYPINGSVDPKLQHMISLCPPEKQKMINKSITEIVKIMISD